MDTLLHVSEDGGKTFHPLGERWKHVDNHALWIDPARYRPPVVGCDGGLYETWDRGQSYRYTANLPITQFYKIAIDNDSAVLQRVRRHAGQRHAGRSLAHQQRARHPQQRLVRHRLRRRLRPGDRPHEPEHHLLAMAIWRTRALRPRSGERIDIKPQEAKGGPPLRWNWDSALILSPHSPTRLYYGAQILFRSDDRGDTWKAVSPDLTRNVDRNTLKVMGRVWGTDAVAKNDSTSFYGTIVALAESPMVEGLLYAGTDDGLIQVTEDGGRPGARSTASRSRASPRMSM